MLLMALLAQKNNGALLRHFIIDATPEN